MRKYTLIALAFLLAFVSINITADEKNDDSTLMKPSTFTGLKFRSIGPALMSGRISDVSIDPVDRSTWYVAVGSGGVWKTVNAGTTFTPIFDEQSSYSIACVLVDPRNPLIVWVGSGENVSGRHVGYGDGIYKSTDGGQSWKNMGLAESMHIGRILIDPRDSNVVYVAAEGPLWSAGGERGLYKTVDGGKTWNSMLSISENTGVTDIEFDPRNPDVIYAATYQRQRLVAALMGGGPESGIHKSTDGGTTWNELKKGLPQVDLGKIDIAVSPQRPDVIYATVETYRGYDWDHNPGGFFRSADGGESWKKMNDYFPIKPATGPHYYQELFCDPHRFDRVYQMDSGLKVTDDGGATFYQVPQTWKHGDNHAMAFDPEDPEYLMVGSDGGLYESFDRGQNWRYLQMPVTQFYKMDVDNDLPFYNVVGGTQDNNTQHGPTRTNNVSGIRDSDWIITVGGDGYACAIDPQDPDTIYSEWQTGGLVRYDRRTGEQTDIKPQPAAGEDPPRWNWDAPLLISPHSHTRLYFGSQYLYRSDDRGNSWRKISPDLSRNINRMRMEYMGRTWGPEAVFDMDAMSYYSNLTTIAESLLVEGLIYVGTDDGLIQVSEDGGETWRKIESIQGIPDVTFVNDVVASLHDPDTVYAVFDNHKRGDLKPYVVVSADRGRTWKSMTGDLPARHIVWSLVQDHIKQGLFFAGTEFGIFFTIDAGDHWIKLKGGVPTIPFRDIVIQRRENDLVGASFGRGFFILDDFSPLRSISEEHLANEATLFSVKNALMYIPMQPFGRSAKATQGASYYNGENPPFGAVVTYYLKDGLKSLKEVRQEKEKKQVESKQAVIYPDWEELRKEDWERESAIVLTITDESGAVIRRLTGPKNKGFHRLAWDLHYSALSPTRLDSSAVRRRGPSGPMVAPGKYTVSLSKYVNGILISLGEPQTFETVPLSTLRVSSGEMKDILAFQKKTGELQRVVMASVAKLNETENQLKYLLKALHDTPGASVDLLNKAEEIRVKMLNIQVKLTGDWTILGRSEPILPSILSRIQQVIGGHWNTTTGPTETHRRDYEIAAAEFTAVHEEIKALLEKDFTEFENAVEEAGAPWTPGRKLPNFEK